MSVMLGSVLISGASRGIGFEMVKQLCGNEKNRIFAACRNPEKASELKSLADKHSNIRLVKLDVLNDTEIEKAVTAVSDATGYLNVLFNNAGIYEHKYSKLKDQKRDVLQHHFNVNVTSSILMAKAFRELLSKGVAHHPLSRKSLIVNFSSILASIASTAIGDGYDYRCSKAALNMANKCLALELAPEGIYSIAVHPGWVRTDMGGKEAPVGVEDSAGGVLKVAADVTEEQNGAFLEFGSGNAIPY